MIRRMLANWPLKLGAFAIATLLWLFVTTNNTATTQRSLLVPISVEGVGAGQVTVGLPEVVEVTVSGPSSRVDRLRPENFDATLDLTGVTNEFSAPITVQPPRGITVLRVNPSDVIGFIESVGDKTIPVDVVLLGATASDQRFRWSVEPAEVSVRGRGRPLQQAVRALALTPAIPGSQTVELFAGDARGSPVEGVTVTPPEVTVTLQAEPVLVERTLPLELRAPEVPRGFTVNVEADQETVQLAGPASLLEPLTGASGRVDLDRDLPVDPATAAARTGGYTLPVRLDLPDGVIALEQPTATVRLSRLRLIE